MSDAQPTAIATVTIPRVTWRDWAPLAVLVITLASLIMIGGQRVRQIDDNTRRIEALESTSKASAEAYGKKLDEMNTRLARIEGKLEVIASAPERMK